MLIIGAGDFGDKMTLRNKWLGLKKAAVKSRAGVAAACYKATGTPAHPFECPLCEQPVRRWLPFSGISTAKPTRGRMCPHCRSLERARAMWLYLRKSGLLAQKPKFLHFAPERMMEKRLRPILAGQYVTTDLLSDKVDTKQDITALTFEDNSFDVIYCSHVLEHVPDDAAAMREMRRTLRPGGTAIILVPLREGVTDEDLSVTDPGERVRRYGQSDHVRYYGRDIADRLRAAGFTVTEEAIPGFLGLSPEEITRYNINVREYVYFCRK